ncbi:MAG: hypothetical protein J0M02_00505 [Planctomycetes bacterium]|nr:hypothetical protein [Planctomycetota bacterium]
MATPITELDLDNMRFEFFAWAAARAAQAGSSKTTVAVLRQALINADAANWHRIIAVDSAQAYDAWHIGTIETVYNDLSSVPSMSWGIAAKLVNVYIKGRWLLDSGPPGPMQSFGHPAIDSILLALIDKAYGSTHARSLRWQRMTRSEYLDVISQLRSKHPTQAIWTIEAMWSAAR